MSRAPAAPRRLHGRALHLDGGADVGGAGDGVGGRPLPSFVAAQGATTLPPPCLKGAFRIFRPRRAADKFGEACVIVIQTATQTLYLKILQPRQPPQLLQQGEREDRVRREAAVGGPPAREERGGALARDERPQRRPRVAAARHDPRLDRVEGGRDRRRHDARDHLCAINQSSRRRVVRSAAKFDFCTGVITEVTMCSENGSAPLSSRAKAGCRASRDFA